MESPPSSVSESPPPPVRAPEPPPARSLGVRLADRWHRLPRWARFTAMGGLLGAVVLGVAWNRCGFQGCPDVHRLSSYQPGGAPVLLDRNGRVFADVTPVEGELVHLKSLPRYVGEAFIAVEDQRFREHGAVDVRRVFGALLANLRSRKVDEGFSTITMQLARNVFPDRLPGSRRTLRRKLLEVRVAQEIEDEFDKDEILEMYLNHISFGHGARGIEAASRYYFGRPAKSLTLPQAALLAALPKAPSHYDPRRHPKPARERRNLVLTLMEEQKRISPAEAEQARKAPLGVVSRPRALRASAPFAGWFVEEARRQLEETLGPDLYDEKLRVHTTLDADMQKAAEEELGRQLQAIESGARGRFAGPRYTAALETAGEETPYLQGAVVTLDVDTGDVRAWVGGRDFRHSRFDRVKGAHRQAGSAFKPFVYAAALASGRTLNQTVIDEPLRVQMDRRRVWEPRNFDGAFDGPVTIRDALVRSRNIPTIRLATDVGYGRVAELAERAGIEDPIPRQPSMALGTVAVSPLEMAAAYTAFAGLGEGSRPRLIVKVERGNGEIVWQAERPERSRVLEPGVAYLVTDALREALVRGTGASVRQTGFRGPAAGKTGTTNDGADAWFVGYTPELVAVVWVGFDQQRPIVDKATGGRLAAPVWARMMMRYYSGGRAAPDWPRPPDILEGWVDPSSGMLLAPGCRPWEGVARRELFIRGMAPVAVCPNQGQPQPLDLVADYDLPDYEEGMQTGLLPEDLPPPRREGIEDDDDDNDNGDNDNGDNDNGDNDNGDKARLRSFVPSPRPEATPPAGERPPAVEAVPSAAPSPGPSPVRSPTPPPAEETDEEEPSPAASPSPRPDGG